VLYPATTEEKFHAVSGSELLKKSNAVNMIAQLRRFEKPLKTTKGILRLVGIWQTNLRSDEQTWRALAGYPTEILLNISIRPTTLFEGERRALFAMQQAASSPQDEPYDEPYLQNYKAWVDQFISRHISPWNRYFYLQIHLASPGGIDEYIFRSIGSSITRENPDQSSPGYQMVRPPDNKAASEWRNYLDNLEMIHTDRSLLLPRLSELANLEEAHAVFRLPYLPSVGLPGTEFLAL
jgi:hypothetical protein